MDWFLYDNRLRHERVKSVTDQLFSGQANVKIGVLVIACINDWSNIYL